MDRIKSDELRMIRIEKVTVKIIHLLGVICAVLGLFGVLDDDSILISELFPNENMALGVLALGFIIGGICTIKMYFINKREDELKSDQGK